MSLNPRAAVPERPTGQRSPDGFYYYGNSSLFAVAGLVVAHEQRSLSVVTGSEGMQCVTHALLVALRLCGRAGGRLVSGWKHIRQAGGLLARRSLEGQGV